MRDIYSQFRSVCQTYKVWKCWKCWKCRHRCSFRKIFKVHD